jgi:hypothetical protein
MRTRKKVQFVAVYRLRLIPACLAAFCLLFLSKRSDGQDPPTSFELYVRRSVVDKKTLDVFLDPNQLSWAKFDPITGYRLGNYMPRDGINQSSTISTSQSNGMRTAHAYVNKPCRINTYGDSFTLCHQVSDSETWAIRSANNRFLKEQHFGYFDMNLVHVQDYKNFSIPFGEYMKRYFIGHYSPAGNHFFAFAIKDTVIDWLEPKPITYQNQAERAINFEVYLPK